VGLLLSALWAGDIDPQLPALRTSCGSTPQHGAQQQMQTANTDMFIHLTNSNHKLAERSAAPIRTAAFGGSASFSCRNMSQSLIIIVVYVGQVLWKHWLNMERNFFPPRVILPRVIRTDNNER